jgi:uncharacterized protein YeaO (DUF488 family)
MAIYTASYFEPKHHHGKLISISRSIPKNFAVQEQLFLLAPSRSLLDDWKTGSIDPQQYTSQYRKELLPNLPKIQQWLNAIDSADDFTLLCWERAGEFCHRNLAIKLVEKFRPDCFGGCDVPAQDPNKAEFGERAISAEGTCPKCHVQLMPGLDHSFCPSCHRWV